MLLRLDIVNDPLVAQRLTNVGKAFSGGAAPAYLTDKAINVLNDAQIGSALYDILHPIDPANHNFIADLQSKFLEAGLTVSPLVLDLDGDGVETIGKSAGIHFDHDGNGFAETTGWAGKDDGLLVWDRNGNGKIDDGGELFGNQTKLADGSTAINGFAALAELDSNHEGSIDRLDDKFSQLLVWKDIDSNAIVSNEELLGLDAVGIQSINLTYVQRASTDAQGNQHLQVGQYTHVDGSVSAIDDVWFDADMARTRALNTVVIASDIAALPDLEGFGNVQSLHQAMARDASGKLQSLLRQFMKTTGSDERKAVLDDILYTWTGSDLLAANDRGSYFGDVRRLYTLEAFLGEKNFFSNTAKTREPMIPDRMPPRFWAKPMVCSRTGSTASWWHRRVSRICMTASN